MERSLILIFVLFFSTLLPGQKLNEDTILYALRKVTVMETSDSIIKINLRGQIVSALVSDRDTLYLAGLENVNVTSPRSFDSREEYLKYLKYRRYAAKVYPYAQEAMRIFREAEHATVTLKKRKRKKYLRKLSKELQKEFETPLKNLSKTQGKIMVKMIERELDKSMFDLIHMTQGKWKAFYWNQSIKLYGYRLKTGYIVGQNPILDVVLQDFNISYEIEEQQTDK